MKKNIAMLRKVGGLGLAGAMVFGATQTQAEPFTATADVQSTLAITAITDLSFGQLYAATASSGDVDSLTLNPDTGDLGQGPATGTSISLVPLGGTVAPGSGTVSAGSTNFFLDLPDDASNLDGSSNLASDGNIVEMTIAGNDPDVAKFLLTGFRVSVLSGGSLVGITDPVSSVPDVEIEPDFGGTDVVFNVGANIYTDDGAGLGGFERTGYEDGTYSGTFTVTAEF